SRFVGESAGPGFGKQVRGNDNILRIRTQKKWKHVEGNTCALDAHVQHSFKETKVAAVNQPVSVSIDRFQSNASTANNAVLKTLCHGQQAMLEGRPQD